MIQLATDNFYNLSYSLPLFIIISVRNSTIEHNIFCNGKSIHWKVNYFGKFTLYYFSSTKRLKNVILCFKKKVVLPEHYIKCYWNLQEIMSIYPTKTCCKMFSFLSIIWCFDY